MTIESIFGETVGHFDVDSEMAVKTLTNGKKTGDGFHFASLSVILLFLDGVGDVGGAGRK